MAGQWGWGWGWRGNPEDRNTALHQHITYIDAFSRPANSISSSVIAVPAVGLSQQSLLFSGRTRKTNDSEAHRAELPANSPEVAAQCQLRFALNHLELLFTVQLFDIYLSLEKHNA